MRTHEQIANEAATKIGKHAANVVNTVLESQTGRKQHPNEREKLEKTLALAYKPTILEVLREGTP